MWSVSGDMLSRQDRQTLGMMMGDEPTFWQTTPDDNAHVATMQILYFGNGSMIKRGWGDERSSVKSYCQQISEGVVVTGMGKNG